MSKNITVITIIIIIIVIIIVVVVIIIIIIIITVSLTSLSVSLWWPSSLAVYSQNFFYPGKFLLVPPNNKMLQTKPSQSLCSQRAWCLVWGTPNCWVN